MARLTYKVEFSISTTSADEKDLGNGSYSTRTDANTEGGTWRTTVPASSTDYVINLDNIDSVTFLFLRLTKKTETDPTPEVSFKIDNIANTPVVLKPPEGRETAMFLITTSGISSIYVTNAGTFPVSLTVSAAGD